MKKALSLFLALLALSATAATYPPNHPGLQYTGRVDFSDKTAPKITWPATQLRIKFTGASLNITLDDEKGKNSFMVFVDDHFEQGKTILCEPGEKTYTLAEGLGSGTHSVLLYKRSEGGQGLTTVKGIALAEGGKLVRPDPRPTFGIEIIGDSVACGLGNEAPSRKQEHDGKYKNAFLSFSAIAARELNATYMCTSKSGIGLIKSWFPTTMPQYYDRLLGTSTEGTGAEWGFKWQPNLVIINLLQNDSWTIKKNDPEAHVQAYADFVREIRGHYPKAHILCTLGPMSASRGKWAGYVKDAVTQLKSAGDQQVSAYIFKTQTGDKHPLVKHHQAMAEELIAVIKERGINSRGLPSKKSEVRINK